MSNSTINKVAFSVLVLGFGFFIDSANAVGLEEQLPKGVPDKTLSREACFLPGELEAFEANIPRVKGVSGCSQGVIAPQTEVVSYRVYEADDDTHSIINCRSYRANEFNSRYLNIYMREVIGMADQTAEVPYAPNVLCVANMLHYWASRNAMTKISDKGSSFQAKADRMWTIAGLATSYFKHLHIRQRAEGIPAGDSNKNIQIKKWFLNIGQQISSDIDVTRANGNQNNLQYWRAFALLSISLLNTDRSLLLQSRRVFWDALAQIENSVPDQDRGFLPLELERATKALSYHGFALSPILGMAVLSRSYGCSFVNSPWKFSQIERLTRKTIQGFYQRQVFIDAVYRQTGIEVSKMDGFDARPMMFFANELSKTANTSMSKNVVNFIQQQTGNSLAINYGRSSGNPKLGGSYSKLAAESERLMRQSSIGLGCTAD